MKKIITSKSEKFLEQYLNNASPTGFESPGQKLWMDYMRPYTDEFIIDNYGSVAAVINPGMPYKYIILPAMALFICEEMAVQIT